ncbi:hypothetical protein C4B63_4g585 [Trypanosoma cruzi]|uniref:Uncharacterized protein n=1 Tax=Trypanosoma cruzi TaxID=5693 RepID=A0A2V2VY24_TRYCR|nr:hypothetical protein C4B63_4g585 [Trypanosoma cruzi]
MRRRGPRKGKKPLSVPLTAEGLRGKMRQIGEANGRFQATPRGWGRGAHCRR